MDTRTDRFGASKNADEAIEQGLRSIDSIADLTRQNIEAMLMVAQVANQSFQGLVSDVAEYSRKNLERTATTVHAMTTVTSPAELAQLQAEFARTQFEAAMAEMAKFSEAMFRTAREQIAVQRTSAQPEPHATAPRPQSRKRTKG